MYLSIDQFNDSLKSKVISFLRFPLIVAVTYIHCEPSAISDYKLSGAYELLYIFVREILAGAAVPRFFVISGFLFFVKGPLTPSAYVSKLKKRIQSLLIPYIIWNLLYWGIFILKSKILPGDLSIGALTHLTTTEFLRMFWNLRSGFYPMCAQFWFLRDLMVMMVLSPIIYICVKYLKLLFVVIFGLMWIFNFGWEITGLSITSIFFFSVGAYIALFKINFVKFSKYGILVFFIMYTILSSVALYSIGNPMMERFKTLSILCEMICIIGLTTIFIRRGLWEPNNFLSESSFFIYASHQIILAILVKQLVSLLSPMDGLKLTIIFLVSPIIIICVSLIIYWQMRKTMPLLTKILTGGR